MRSLQAVASAVAHRGSANLRALLSRYLPAIVIVAVAVALRLWLEPYLGGSGFALFLTAILVAAWMGGLGPALIAQTLLLFATAYWFSPSHKLHNPLTLQGIISLIAYFSVGGIVGSLSEAWRASRNRLKAQTQEAVSQREQLRAVLTCLADGVLVTDMDGRLTMMNPQAELMTGWTIRDAIGKSVLDVFVVADEQDATRTENPVGRVLRGQQVVRKSSRLSLTTRGGEQLPVSYTAAPVYDQEVSVKGIVIVIRDETQQRQTEQELRDADRRKDEFLATLAHELRNPLAPIAMGLQLLQEESDPESTAEIVSLMDRQARHMVRLIDDLLDVSRITRGKLELRCRAVSAREIVQSAIEAVNPAIIEAEHEFSLELPERPILLRADPNRLTQVLSNLLDNAVKYTPPGGKVTLSAQAEGNELVMSVTDSGCGIAQEKLSAIFEMFMQVRGKMENGHKGLGIGLTLVKQLVEMHGGRIEAESEGLDRGSTFRVRLPILIPSGESRPEEGTLAPTAPRTEVLALEPASVEALVPQSGEGSPAKEAGRKVLVVDDNADALQSLSLLVSRLGNETHLASDGLEALELAERVVPDVVLMDIGMPRLNGFDAARRMRQRPWGENLLLVATTGWGQEEDRRRTKEAGFDHHLVKPVDVRQLKELLEGPSPEGDPDRHSMAREKNAARKSPALQS